MIGHLTALKLLSRDDEARPQDGGDVRTLIGIASEDDVDSAREPIRLIESRGLARWRGLAEGLGELLSEAD